MMYYTKLNQNASVVYGKTVLPARQMASIMNLEYLQGRLAAILGTFHLWIIFLTVKCWTLHCLKMA